MVFWRLVMLLITLISISFQQSNAHSFVHLAQPPDFRSKLDNQFAPSPSYVAAANANLGTNQAPVGQPTAAFASVSCTGASNKCVDDHISMTACFFPSKKGHEESFLLVHNNGENPLMLKVNVSPANKAYDNVQIPRHDVKQINIPSKIGASSSTIMLDAGTGKCTIDIRRSVWQGFFNLPYSYTTYITPTNGAYLLGVTALLIGGIFICCKLRKQDRHLDGVAYQELEMGKPELQSSIKLETNTEGWNESWDDDWDEEEAVKSPGGKNISRKLANGFDDSHHS
ncbi:PREDICTED: uncharacterized protein LOC109206789 [Nicotiana attenuata]|uniref:DUF7356 domain-containing protein n=1 Tax=Nicotiana attenuata TaxID=49451 RepID=A0A314KVM1_NICAT|nr:PREDICTED: uncharacterized protein LOC109206789 [Nicotiana attenuata]OIT32829.1 hypothetical protein A4A49_07996 [Nicotiana attenuata]